MYRIVLVDDEPWSLKELSHVFNWEGENFKLELSTSNPLEALDYISSHSIDVVFTDIRMPELSGLQLMQQLRKMGNDSEFVFISGFTEFSYVQQALKEGAFDYLLKPVIPNDADSLLKRLKLQLENKRLNKDIEDFDCIMLDMLNAREFFDSRRFSPECNPYTVLSIIIKDKNDEPRIQKILSDLLTSSINLYLGSGKYTFLIFTQMDDLEFIKEVNNMLGNEKKIFVGISSFSEDLLQLSRLLKESEAAIRQSFICEHPRIIEYKKSGNASVKKLIALITKEFEANDEYALSKVLKNIPCYIKDNSLGILDVLFLWNQLVAYLTGKYDESMEEFNIKFMDLEHITSQFADLSELCDFLRTILLTYISKENLHSVPVEATNAFKDLFAYVNENYCSDLSLKSLSDQFFISFTYASALFKKHIGKTFSDYTSDLRMKKALQLMKDTTLSIEDICSQVGYNDYFYFNKLFKKYFGMPPYKYRKVNLL